MTDTDLSDHSHRCGEDVAAYALGALTPAEAEAFRAHLAQCAVCAEELAGFERVIDELALSAPQHHAPPKLRRRVRQAIAQHPRPGPGSARRSARWRWRSLARRPAAAFGAAVVLAAAVFAGVQLSSPVGVRVIQAQVTGHGTAQLRLSADHGELVVRHLAAPPAGHVYEVWLVRGQSAPVPANALFDVDAAGDRAVRIPGSLHGVAQVAVTPEPAGGSPAPTHAPVIQVVLSQ